MLNALYQTMGLFSLWLSLKRRQLKYATVKRVMPRFFAHFTALGLVTITTFAHALPENFSRETVLNVGNSEPVNLVLLPDGNFLLAEKHGTIKVLNADTLPAVTSLVVTLDQVNSGQERGLASIALDPEFAFNGHIYVYYTRNRGSNVSFNRISRLTMIGNTADLSSEMLVWEDNERATSCCHFGGGLDFGPDGYLYLTTGEEFEPAQAQDLGRAGGKVIRLDTSTLDTVGPWIAGSDNDHLIPDDNPFIDGAGGNLDEIWALGLRNPFRAYWDLQGNRFFIGEVGGNEQGSAREDLHIGRAGANYGWPDCEGSCNDPRYDDPLYSYEHTGATPSGGAIAAGVVYRGNVYPNVFNGAFFFADYAQSVVRYLTFNPDGSVDQANDFDSDIGAPVAMEQGQDGAVYVVDYGGRIVRYRFSGSNQPPTVETATATPTSGSVPLEVSFSAQATDIEGDALLYEWDFGDGSQGTGATTMHTYDTDGMYTASVSVSDGELASISEPISIQVGSAPQVSITAPVDGAIFSGGDTISFSGNVLNPDVSPPYSFRWDVEFIHNAHTHPTVSTDAQSGSFVVNTEGHDYHDDTGYRLSLTVTDAAGRQTTESVTIRPEKVNLSLSTEPGGLQMFIDGAPLVTPIVYDTMTNFNHALSVPATQCNDGTQLSFTGWSDGGAREHVVNTGDADITLVANYSVTGACTTMANAPNDDNGVGSLGSVPSNGLVAHFEADEQVLVAGNNVVIAWDDLSDSGNRLSAIGDPTLNMDALDGRPTISFDGDGDALQRLDALVNLPAGGEERTMYLLARYNSVGIGGAVYGTATRNEAFGLVVNDIGNLSVQGWGRANDFESEEPGTGQGFFTQAVVYESGTLTHMLNGEVIGTEEHRFETNPSRLVLGSELDGAAFLEMEISALLIYNRALSFEEQGDLETYLENKYLREPGTPLAINDTGLVNYEGTVQLDVLANDIDVQGLNVGSMSIIRPPANGTATANTDGTISYSHNGSFVLDDSFTYRASSADGGLSNEATVMVTVAGTGMLPGGSVVLADAADTTEQIFSLTTSSIDRSAVARAASRVSSVLHADHHGDHRGLSADASSNSLAAQSGATYTLHAEPDRGLLGQGGTVVLDILQNDKSADVIVPTSVVAVETPRYGSIDINSDGSVTYLHDGGAATRDSFSYNVADADGLRSNTATVDITILRVNPAPSASAFLADTDDLPESGLSLHLEAGAGVEQAASGAIQLWMDQSSAGNTLLAHGQPVVVVDDVSGNLVLTMDGFDDAITGELSMAGDGFSVYVVARYLGSGDGNVLSLSSGAYGDTAGIEVGANGRFKSRRDSNTLQQTSTDAAPGVVVLNTRSQGSLITEEDTFITFGLGAIDATETSNSVAMQVGTLLLYDRQLSDAEHDAVMSHLLQKYGD